MILRTMIAFYGKLKSELGVVVLPENKIFILKKLIPNCEEKDENFVNGMLR